MKFDGINNDPVGPQLMCAFQTLSYIDELKYFSLKDDLELDDNDLLQVLHRLLSLILFHHYIRKLSNKRRIIVRVIAMENNFLSLLHFIELDSKYLFVFIRDIYLMNRRYRSSEKFYSNTLYCSNYLRIIRDTGFDSIVRTLWSSFAGSL
jgi:hypothetical protein